MDALTKLKHIRENYAKDLPNKLQEIYDLFDTIKSEGFNDGKLEMLYRLAHNLVGAGATFGYIDVSAVARKLVIALEKYVDDYGVYPSKKEIEDIDTLIFDLHDLDYVDKLPQTNKNAMPVSKLADETDKKDDNISKNDSCVYILDSDKTLLSEISLYLENFGYTLSIFEDIKSFNKTIDILLPDIVLMDISFGDLDDKNFQDFLEIKKENREKCKLFVLSKNENFITRAHAVKLDCDAFVTKPVDMQNLTKLLDKFGTKYLQGPIRALLLDDESTINQYHASLLESMNIDTMCISNPEEILDTMSFFQPDIVITDLYMPKYSGEDVLKIIRQIDNYLSIPIIFLSVETESHVKHKLINMGSEYFLQKPVNIGVFSSIVKSKAQRYKNMREMIQLDGLTNLYNHSNIMTLLAKETASSKRYNYPLSFAMIDLDSFKIVNDTYGHQAGDIVLQTLAKLLKTAIRSTDIVGRYGGEEFCIIFPHTKIDATYMVLENIRKSFGRIEHTFNNKKFNVTLSLGVVEHKESMTIAELINKADEALYKAKANGKNTVVKA